MFIPFEKIEQATADSCHIAINGQRLATAASPARAAELVATINDLRLQPRGQREARLTAWLRDFHDEKAVAARLAEYHAAVATLRGVCMLLLFILFAAAPVLVWAWSLEQIWWILLLVIVPPWWLAAVLYWRADRRLTPGNTGLRVERALTMLALPVAAARGSDFVARHLLTGFHPLAIGRVLLSQERFVALAGPIWRDVEFGVVDAGPLADDPVRRAGADWFRLRMRAELEGLLVRSGVWPADLVNTPQREEGGCLSYCPRCQEQSRLPKGDCPFCGPVQLQLFPEVARLAGAAAAGPGEAR